MKHFAAFMLLFALAAVASAQAPTRVTRPPTRPPPTTRRAVAPPRQNNPVVRPVPERSTTRKAGGAPTRQQNPVAPPIPTRQGATTTRAGGAPPVPTRQGATTTRAGGAPPVPTRNPVAPPVPTRNPNPQVPTRNPNPGPNPNPQVPDNGIPTPPSGHNPAPTVPAPILPPGVAPPGILLPPGVILPPGVVLPPGIVLPPGLFPPGIIDNGRTTTRSPRVSAVGIPDQRCPRSQDPRNPTHLPHATNCERFYKCDAGLAFEYQCPVGQHWNAARNFCDFPINANCGGNMWNQSPNQPWSNQPNWNQPPNQPWNNQPNWNNQRPSFPQQPQAPDFKHPIYIPMQPVN